MSTNKFESSIANGPHHQLINLLGKWSGVTKTWFEADILADESIHNAAITSVLEGRFISLDYIGKLSGSDFSGKMVIGFDIPKQQYSLGWIDSFHMNTQMMLSHGQATENGFSVLGSYADLDNTETWGWKTQFEWFSKDEFVVTAYNISPNGLEAKAIETVYFRKF